MVNSKIEIAMENEGRRDSSSNRAMRRAIAGAATVGIDESELQNPYLLVLVICCARLFESEPIRALS